MASRKRDSISLDQLDPFDMEVSAENVALVEKALAKHEKKGRDWARLLSGWKEELGLAPDVPKVPRLAATVIRHPRRTTKHLPFQHGGDLNLIAGSMADTVYKILTDAGRPITFQELEQELKKTELADKITKLDKPHYSAVQRLRTKGFVLNHNGRISTPGNLQKFLEEVAAGHAEDVSVPRFRNKWAEEIVAFLDGRPEGATVREMIDHLKSIPGFREETINYKTTYIYNVISRLKDRAQLIEKCGKTSYRLCKFANGAGHEAPSMKAQKIKVTEGKPSVTH